MSVKLNEIMIFFLTVIEKILSLKIKFELRNSDTSKLIWNFYKMIFGILKMVNFQLNGGSESDRE